MPSGYFCAIFFGSNSSLASKTSLFASQMLSICATFSSRVMRLSRSSTRASTGARGSLYAGTSGAASVRLADAKATTTATVHG